MLTGGIDMTTCPDLAVPLDVMRHVVRVESGANPYAIGVVGARLLRQPRKLDEAVATARMLEAQGYNFSLGIAQINRSNLSHYGLDTHEKAFDACANLAAGSRILAGCHASAGGDWGKAFSCYYSGNFVTGFRHGYVQKIYDSIQRGIAVADNGGAAMAPARAATPVSAEPARAAEPPPANRIALRSSPLNAAAHPAPPGAPAAPPAVTEIFVPQVQGPGEPAAPAGRTDLRQDARDSAFVF
jgi:type IV secretion system protein VirB1